MIPAKDAQLRGYRAMPASGGPFPVVLVAAEVFGLNPYMKDVCRRLAKAGYYAVVPDLYTRKADLTKVTDMKDIMPVVNSKYDTELVSDYDATVAYAAASGKADTSRMAITGFCRGGRTTLFYAESNPKLKAACAWYGPVGGQANEYTPKTAMDRVAELKVPLLGLYGAKDAGIPVDGAKFFAALKAQGHKSGACISGRRARLPRRFPGRHLPEGRRRGRLEQDARVVQEARRCLTHFCFGTRPNR
jgi:carboxymethylenebutenolidase